MTWNLILLFLAGVGTACIVVGVLDLFRQRAETRRIARLDAARAAEREAEEEAAYRRMLVTIAQPFPVPARAEGRAIAARTSPYARGGVARVDDDLLLNPASPISVYQISSTYDDASASCSSDSYNSSDSSSCDSGSGSSD